MKYLRYYSDFLDITSRTWRVEILQEADVAYTPEEITLSGESPLNIDWHTIEKTDTIMSSAATLRLNSDSDRQFIDMYTIEVGSVRLDVYCNGALYWSGTLDTELYEEPYSFQKNYDVELTFSDFAVLERKDCTLSGFKSIREIIDFCLEATGVQYSDLVQHISTSRSGVAAANLLNNDTVVSDNFYDEDGEPMSLMEVLEGVLKPYDLHIRQKAGKIYLWDWNALCNVQSERIVWDSDDAVLSVDAVYNKVKINFSPYQIKELLASKIKPKSFVSELQTDKIVYADMTEELEGFKVAWGRTATGLNLTNASARFYRILPITSGDESYGIAWCIDTWRRGQSAYTTNLNRPSSQTSGELFACPERPWITYRGGAVSENRLKISLDLLFDPRYNPFESEVGSNEEKNYNKQQNRANFAYIPIRLILRDANGTAIAHYENYRVKDGFSPKGTAGWVAGEGSWGLAWLCWYDETDRKSKSGFNGFVSNKRCIGYYRGELPKSFTHSNSGEIIQLPQYEGWLDLRIGNGVITWDWNKVIDFGGGTLDLSILNLNHNQVYEDAVYGIKFGGDDIDKEDIEIKAWINRSAKEELSIDTIVGTTKGNITIAKGFIRDKNSGNFPERYSRNGKLGTLEQLLIGTIYTHHARRHTKLSGTARALAGFNTYRDAATNELFAVMGENQDVMQDCSDIQLCEISKDEYNAIEYDED